MPDQDPTGRVARGMRALLGRRDRELAAGARQVGWKIGFNTAAIQQHFGLTDPVVGYLLDTGVTASGSAVDLTGWSAPAVEVELAIRVGDDGGVGGLAPALELVDLGVSFDDIEPVLAGNICHRGVVFGEEVAGVDPWATRVTVTKAGAVVAEGDLEEDPATTVAFVRTFLTAHGAALEPGHRIIAGSMVPPVTVAAGDELLVGFGPLGELQITFAP
jgi:2-keto-4-pentenoate hydratase